MNVKCNRAYQILNPSKISVGQRLSLDGAIREEVRNIAKARHNLGHLSPLMHAHGLMALGSEAEFAIWLCTPQQALESQRPGMLLRTIVGRTKVLRVLDEIIRVTQK